MSKCFLTKKSTKNVRQGNGDFHFKNTFDGRMKILSTFSIGSCSIIATISVCESEIIFVAVVMVVQAWHISAAKRLGRWTGLCNPVPHTTREQVHLQIQHHRPRRHPLVARPHIVAQGNSLRSPNHPAARRPNVPVPHTPQGIPYFVRYPLNTVLKP